METSLHRPSGEKSVADESWRMLRAFSKPSVRPPSVWSTPSPLALPLAPGRTCRTATRAWVHRFALPLGLGCTDSHCHSSLNVPPRTFTAEWQCETHCHSSLGCASRADRTATRPSTFRPVRSPPSGSVNHTSTRPWTYQAHCHSPLGRADSMRSIPSGSVRRTATRPLGVPAAPIALPLGPWAFRAFSRRANLLTASRQKCGTSSC